MPTATKVGRNSINVTLRETNSLLPHVIELAVSKQAELIGADKATVRITVGPGLSTFLVDNLHLGTAYYIRSRAVDAGGVLGQQSKWSDQVELPCPEGAMCGAKGTLEGVAITNVFPLPEYYRVPWAKDNLTFALCSASGTKCVGGKNETCSDGTTGPFCESRQKAYIITSTRNSRGLRALAYCCSRLLLPTHANETGSECLPNYARSGPGKCDKCMQPALQNFAFLGAVVAGIGTVAYLIRGTLKAEGNPSDVSMGVIKIGKSPYLITREKLRLTETLFARAGMRHFQLAAMAASFPLEWPPQINDMFAVMSTASSAGDQAVALDCQLRDVVVPGSSSLYFGSMFSAKSLFGFLTPPLLIAGFAVFWVLYTRYFEGRPFGDRGSRGNVGDGTHQSSLKTRLIVST